MLKTVPRPTGSTPNPDYRALTVRLPRELVERIENIARKEERSLNFVTARLLREALEERGRA